MADISIPADLSIMAAAGIPHLPPPMVEPGEIPADPELQDLAEKMKRLPFHSIHDRFLGKSIPL